MKAILYTRVSTESQALEGISLEAQEAKLRAWADLNGYEDVLHFTDAGVSGSKAENREGLRAALQSVGRGDALIVYSLSRLARSTKDTLEISERLQKAGADLVSLSEKIDTTSASGKMVFRLLAVMSEFERDLVAERTKAVMGHMKANKQLVGAVPYGYRLAEDGKTLLEDPEEQKVVSIAKDLIRSGLGLRATARELSGRGFKTRTGRDFDSTQVKRMVAA